MFIVNATNDDQHLNVLNILQHVDGFILSEKPLVAPQDSIPDRWTEAWGSGDRFAMNCIERYSPAVDYVLAQTHRRDLRIARIDFTWRRTASMIRGPPWVSSARSCIPSTCAATSPAHRLRMFICTMLRSLTPITPVLRTTLPSPCRSWRVMNGVAVTGYSSFAHPDRRCAF